MSDLRAEIGRILSRFACDKDINGQMQTERCKDEIEKLIEQEVSDLKSKLAGKEFTTCGLCNGEGYILDNKSTAGN